MAEYYIDENGKLKLKKKNKKKKSNSSSKKDTSSTHIVDSKGKIVENPNFIAPTVKKKSNSKKKSTWFNTSAFDDGYDFGDVTRTIFATGKDVQTDATRGLLKIGEGLIDTGATAVGGISKILGADDLAKKTQKFIERDLVGEYKLDEKVMRSLPAGGIYHYGDKLLNKGKTEKYSLAGNKMDSLVESAGQLGGTIALQSVGVPWQVTTGVTSFGRGTEEAFKETDSYSKAALYGGLSAGIEIGTELLSGGIKLGNTGLDDAVKKKIASKISNRLLKTGTQLGFDAFGEGAEEVVAEIGNIVARELTYENEGTIRELAEDKEKRDTFASKVWGKLTSEEAMEGYKDSFIGGAVMGGAFNVPRATNSIKNDRDYDTGLTSNEQLVVDKEIENRITAKKKEKAAKQTLTERNKKNAELKARIDGEIAELEERAGKTLDDDARKKLVESKTQEYGKEYEVADIDFETQELDKKFLKELEEEVRSDLGRGYIDIETIEDTLAGEKTAQIRELKKQMEAPLSPQGKAELQSKINELEVSRANDMRGLMENDKMLQASYRETALKSETFTRNAVENDTELTRSLEKEFERVAGNDSRTHDMFDFLNKVSNDTGVTVKLLTEKELAEISPRGDGRIPNGYYDPKNNALVLNVNSNKVATTTVVHELSHILEKSGEYKNLKDFTKSFAESNGDYENMVAWAKKVYNENEVETETVAELLGDYLGTNEQFMKDLSAKEPNIFKRMFDYVKHAYKMATAGSKEQRELLKLKRSFEKAYKEINKGVVAKDKAKSLTEADSNTQNKAIKREITAKDKQVAKLEKDIESKQKQVDDFVKEIANWGETKDAPKQLVDAFNDAAWELESLQKELEGLQGEDVKFSLNDDINFDEIDDYELDFLFEELLQEDKELKEIADKWDAKEYSNEYYENLLDGFTIQDLEEMAEETETAEKKVESKKSKYKAKSKEKGKIARLTDERIERLFREYGASNPDYAKAYITSIHPRDFLNLTLPDELFEEWDKAAQEGTNKTLYPLDMERLKNNSQTPFLEIDEARGKVTGHEGRHRMRALLEMGVTEVPIAVIDYDTKYSKNRTKYIVLNSQQFWYDDTGVNDNAMAVLEDLIPLNKKYEDEIKEIYGGDADIKFSLSDSKGRELSKGQQEYFKDSLVRDENGSLKVMYHGSENAGFHTFSNDYSDDGASLFFTDKNTVAKTYSGVHEEYAARTFRTADDINAFFEEIGVDDEYEIREDNGTFEFYVYGELEETSDSAIGIYDEFRYWSGLGDGSGNYEVYLNIKNPLVVEADGKYWDELADMSEDGHLYQEVRSRGKVGEDSYEISYEEHYEGNEGTFTREQLVEKFGKSNAEKIIKGYTLHNIYADKDGNIIPNTTRDYSSYAKENGYDGVIFKNIRDNGLYAANIEKFESSTVVIAFDSNQIKSVANENPTDNPDIRFSLSTEFQPFAKANNGFGKTKTKARKKLQTGREVRTAVMLANGYTQADVDEINSFMDRMAAFMEDAGVKYRYIGLDDVNNAEIKVRYDANGKPKSVIMSAMVRNGDYPVNFDFSSICKKRQSMMAVIEELAKRKTDGNKRQIDSIKLTPKNLWTINEKLREAGMETACLGCFVESKRYNIQAFSDKAVKMWNSIVDEVRGDREVSYFDFAEGVDTNEVDYTAVEEAFKGYKTVSGRTSPEKRMRALITKGGDTYLKYLQPSDLMTPEGIEAIKSMSTHDNNFYGILQGVYGQAAPKEVMAFSPYNSEIALLPKKKGKGKTAIPLHKYIASIGGVRMQSFSDFLVQNVYDYMQMVADLNARRLPAHAYTKEISFAKIFGMTGIKTNLSVMFDINPNMPDEYAGLQFVEDVNGLEVYEGRRGNWEYIIGDAERSQRVFEETGYRPYVQSIGWRDAVKLQNDPRYSANVGIIGVGFSDKHILKMLNDNNVPYIIPYHSSSLPSFIKDVTNIKKATDYTASQSVRKLTKVTDAEGNAVDYDMKAKYDELGSWKAVCEDLAAKSEQGWLIEASKDEVDGSFPLYENLEATKDPRTTADNYIEWCAEKGYLPVFHQFAGHENYYKLLFDFKVYDSVTGEYAPQVDVQNIYPEDVEGIIEKYMSIQNELNKSRDEKIPSIVDDVIQEIEKRDAEELNKVGFSLGEQSPTDIAPYGRYRPRWKNMTRPDVQTDGLAPVKQQPFTPTYEEDMYAPMSFEGAELTDMPSWYLDYQQDRGFEENRAIPPEETVEEHTNEQLDALSPFTDKDIYTIGSDRSRKALIFEEPALAPYIKEYANLWLGEFAFYSKGEKIYMPDRWYLSNGELSDYTGTTRRVEQDMADLLDGVYGRGFTYGKIKEGLEAIVNGDSKANNSISKKLEILIDKRLRYGYEAAGMFTPPSQGYIDALVERDKQRYLESIYKDWNDNIGESDIAPVKEVSNSEETDNNVSVSEEVENKVERKTRKEIKQALIEEDKGFFIRAMNEAKNISKPLMNNTDTIRVTELVFGRANANRINETIFQKAIDNEARSIAWQNKERRNIKSLGINARSKESAAVQKYGEKEYVNEHGELVPYGDKELAQEFRSKKTQEKIKNAAREIRSKYDDYIDTANTVLTSLGFDPIPKRKDYMRHFQELNDVFSRFGIPFNARDMAEHNLPTDINGLTEFWMPQKNFFANIMPRKGVKTTYDAITGVDGYIGGIANLIFHTEDIQRGRAFEDLIRKTYAQEQSGEEFESLSELEKMDRLQKVQDGHLSNYAAWVREWTNNIAGKKNKLDRVAEEMFGREAFAVLDTVRKQVGANMIGYNISSSLTNLIAPVQAMAKTSKIATTRGLFDTFSNIFIKDDFVDKNAFLTNRFGTDMLSKNGWQKIQDTGYMFMKGVDWFSSNLIVRSKYHELVSKGMSDRQAHHEAGKFAARIMGDRTKGANAQFYNSKLFNVVGQFQLEVNNQLYSMFYDTFHDSKENAKGNALKMTASMVSTLGQLTVATHFFGKGFEAIAGYNPTFDIIGIIATALGLGDDEEEKKPLEDRLKAAMSQLGKALPYTSVLDGGRIPIASAIPDLYGWAVGGTDNYGNEIELEDELKKLQYMLLPTGGNQLKKTRQGLSMFDEDLPISGSYTESGNLRFPVEDTTKNRVQAGLFGQWASANARDYFDNDRLPLNEKQTQEFVDLDIPIADYRDYRDGLKGKKSKTDKLDYIANLDLPISKKNLLANNLEKKDKEIDMETYFALPKAVGGSYEEFKKYKKDLGEFTADYDSNGKRIKDSKKKKVAEYIDGLDLAYEEKLILYKMQYPAYDDENETIIDYLDKNEDISYKEMVYILEELGFTVDEDGIVYWD